MRPARIHMNWELGHVQSGWLDMKSSMLRYCNTFLKLNMIVAICVVYDYEILEQTDFLNREALKILLICDKGYHLD